MLSKAEIIRQGIALGVDYSLTVSCYQADEAGRACGVCDSCRLRKAGFEAADVPDPTRYQTTTPVILLLVYAHSQIGRCSLLTALCIV